MAPDEQDELAERSEAERDPVPRPAGDIWARHASGPKRDSEADREIREAMKREDSGEYDADGMFRPSTWGTRIEAGSFSPQLNIALPLTRAVATFPVAGRGRN